MKIITPDEMEAILWRMYRRGAIHGGVVAVVTATVWLML